MSSVSSGPSIERSTPTPLPRGIDVNDARDGLAQAKTLLRPVVKRVRAQAEAVKITDRAATATPKTFRYLQ